MRAVVAFTVYCITPPPPRFSLSLSLVCLAVPSRATPLRCEAQLNAEKRGARASSCRGCGARATTSTSLPDRWIKLGRAVPVDVRTPYHHLFIVESPPSARMVDRWSRSLPLCPSLSLSLFLSVVFHHIPFRSPFHTRATRLALPHPSA